MRYRSRNNSLPQLSFACTAHVSPFGDIGSVCVRDASIFAKGFGISWWSLDPLNGQFLIDILPHFLGDDRGDKFAVEIEAVLQFVFPYAHPVGLDDMRSEVCI